jgi:hypothetical protein
MLRLVIGDKPRTLCIIGFVGFTLFSLSCYANQNEQKALDRYYKSGDFQSVIAIGESNLKSKLATYEDTVFIARYLGVVYASNPNTREKGRFWFRQLLLRAPEANLLDLIVSDAIDQAFTKTRNELLVETPANSKQIETKQAIPNPHSNPEQRLEEPSHGGLWLLGISVVAAGAILSYEVLSPSEKNKTKEIVW